MKKDKLAKAVITKRIDKNLSLEECARQIGISYLTMWKIEDGYTSLSYETIKKIASFLEVSEKEVRGML